MAKTKMMICKLILKDKVTYSVGSQIQENFVYRINQLGEFGNWELFDRLGNKLCEIKNYFDDCIIEYGKYFEFYTEEEAKELVRNSEDKTMFLGYASWPIGLRFFLTLNEHGDFIEINKSNKDVTDERPITYDKLLYMRRHCHQGELRFRKEL